MCCLFAILAMLGPRAAAFVWWLVEPVRWGLAFDSFLVAAFGFLFFPLTTLMYVILFTGGIDGIEWLWMGLAFALDLGTTFGGGFGNRGRFSGGAYA